MALFDFIQNLLGGAAESVQAPLEEITGSLTELDVAQSIQDGIGSITEAGAPLTDTVQNILEGGQEQ